MLAHLKLACKLYTLKGGIRPLSLLKTQLCGSPDSVSSRIYTITCASGPLVPSHQPFWQSYFVLYSSPDRQICDDPEEWAWWEKFEIHSRGCHGFDPSGGNFDCNDWGVGQNLLWNKIFSQTLVFSSSCFCPKVTNLRCLCLKGLDRVNLKSVQKISLGSFFIPKFPSVPILQIHIQSPHNFLSLHIGHSRTQYQYQF